MTHTFHIPEHNLAPLQDKVAQLSKRAAKLHVVPPTFVVGERHERVHRNEITGEVSRVDVWFDVDVTFETIVLAGWALQGTLDHTNEAGVIVRAVPGIELPASYRTSEPVCDHCKTIRRRNKTYVVKHDDGRYATVGHNCVADFLGVDPERALRSLEFGGLFGELFGAAEDEGWGGGGARSRYTDLSAYLAWVAMVIRANGWLSRTKAREFGDAYRATADVARNAQLIYVEKGATELYRQFRFELPTDGDREKVQNALVWARTSIDRFDPNLSDYLYNVSVVAAGEVVKLDALGIAASILPAYDRAMGIQRERKQAENSVHVGTVGAREVFELTPVTERTFESDFGVRTLVRFQDAAGNILVWWTGASPFADSDFGVSGSFKATVKAHDDYKGTKQTVLTRVSAYVPKVKAPRVRKPKAETAATVEA